MPKKTVKLPAYRHHKGSGQAIVQIGGIRHYLGKFGSEKSQERYRRLVAELMVQPIAAGGVQLVLDAPGQLQQAVVRLSHHQGR